MPISIHRYVNITSGVAVGLVVPRRNLVTRVFTENALVPPLSYIQFSTAAEVGQYFGTTSEEYQRAVFYFSWISKIQTKPQFIQFARWTNAAVAPTINGIATGTQSVAAYKALVAPNFNLTLQSETHNIAPTFSAATTLDDIAAEITTAITGVTSNLDQWKHAVVTFDATRGAFHLVGGSALSANVSVTPGTTTTSGAPPVFTAQDVAVMLGWYPQQTITNTGAISAGAQWISGGVAETALQTVQNSAKASDNFGSFCFCGVNNVLADVIAIAQWNESLNVEFMYLLPIFSANLNAGQSGDMNWAATDGTAVGLIGGVVPTLHGGSGEFHEMIPGMILAATPYNQPNSVQNYMYQQFNVTPTVTTDTQADFYDSLNVNYYGSSQDAGQPINFYQRGVMFGLPADPADINIYANEMWLKDAIQGRILTALLGLSRISANVKGRSQLTTIISPILTEALSNGTVSPGKTLTAVQQLYITEITNDNTTWHQVQTLGYYFNVQIVFNENALPKPGYEADYLLVYSKDDDIRKVNGRHTLI